MVGGMEAELAWKELNKEVEPNKKFPLYLKAESLEEKGVGPVGRLGI